MPDEIELRVRAPRPHTRPDLPEEKGDGVAIREPPEAPDPHDPRPGPLRGGTELARVDAVRDDPGSEGRRLGSGSVPVDPGGEEVHVEAPVPPGLETVQLARLEAKVRAREGVPLERRASREEMRLDIVVVHGGRDPIHEETVGREVDRIEVHGVVALRPETLLDRETERDRAELAHRVGLPLEEVSGESGREPKARRLVRDPVDLDLPAEAEEPGASRVDVRLGEGDAPMEGDQIDRGDAGKNPEKVEGPLEVASVRRVGDEVRDPENVHGFPRRCP
jgi:hypothetical protein